MGQEQKDILKSRIEKMKEKLSSDSSFISLSASMRSNLAEISEERIAEGRRLCHLCKKPITLERLALMPESTLCAACANGAS